MSEFDWSKVRNEYVKTPDKTKFYSERVPALIAKEASKIKGETTPREKLKLASVGALKNVDYVWNDSAGAKVLSEHLAELAYRAGSKQPTFDAALMLSNLHRLAPHLNLDANIRRKILVKNGYISIEEKGVWLCHDLPLLEEIGFLDLKTKEGRRIIERNAVFLNALSALTPLNLDKIASSASGRQRLRDYALNPDGTFKLPRSHPLYKVLKIHHLYHGERIRFGGQALVYRNGDSGLTYYYLGGAKSDQPVALRTGMRIELAPRYKGPIPERLKAVLNVSPVQARLKMAYQYASPNGRRVLESSTYSAREWKGQELLALSSGLETSGRLQKLDREGWKKGYAGLIFGLAQPQTLLLLNKDSNGAIVSARSYRISAGKNGLGYGPDGSFRTLPGLARVDFHYGSYEGKSAFHQIEPGALFHGQTVGGLIGGVSEPEGVHAVMSTRILSFSGLEEENKDMKERHFYLHGTNKEADLGKAASSGCVRVSNLDILEIAELLPPQGMMIDLQNNVFPEVSTMVARNPQA